MKIKGKISLWFWLLTIGVNILLFYTLIFKHGRLMIMLPSILFCNLVFLPIILRNYVIIENGVLTLYFGITKDSIKLRQITEVYTTRNVMATSAASLDRVVIRGRGHEIICSVVDKDLLFQELKKKNRSIKFK